MRTETLAIVFTDIKGYTAATSTQTHQQNARMLRRIERLIAPVVRAYDGRVVKSIGDAYMIVFRSPTEAVRCATAIQDRLHLHNQEPGGEPPIHIRIAMNVGEVRVHRGDVFGEPVNIAARIESITPADEVYFSEAVYLTMNRSDLPSERVGEFELKGVPEPVTVYRAKKAALASDASPEEPSASLAGAAPLPFGGAQLDHWRRMQWVRRAYAGVWALALCGIGAAAYLRYRPTADYTPLLVSLKAAIEEGNPVNALALAGQIPPEAVQERSVARRYRKQAVAVLMDKGDLEVAAKELAALLNEDSRDAEAQLLMGVLQSKRGRDPKAAMNSIAAALKINETLGGRPELVAAVVQAYRDPGARRIAERLVEVYVKQNAVPALIAAFGDPSFDLKARVAIGLRLEKLGAAQDVDWVTIALEELRSTNCKTRKNAISRLVAEGDERAVGPLMKVADSKGCAAGIARKAIDSILGK